VYSCSKQSYTQQPTTTCCFACTLTYTLLPRPTPAPLPAPASSPVPSPIPAPARSTHHRYPLHGHPIISSWLDCVMSLVSQSVGCTPVVAVCTYPAAARGGGCHRVDDTAPAIARRGKRWTENAARSTAPLSPHRCRGGGKGPGPECCTSLDACCTGFPSSCCRYGMARGRILSTLLCFCACLDSVSQLAGKQGSGQSHTSMQPFALPPCRRGAGASGHEHVVRGPGVGNARAVAVASHCTVPHLVVVMGMGRGRFTVTYLRGICCTEHGHLEARSSVQRRGQPWNCLRG
jgi:hypothetical protein